MKKSKILVVALIGLLLAGGLFFASCDDLLCSNGGKCIYNKDESSLCGNTDSCGAVVAYNEGYTSGSCSCK
jgi:hypothetical protein